MKAKKGRKWLNLLTDSVDDCEKEVNRKILKLLSMEHFEKISEQVPSLHIIFKDVSDLTRHALLTVHLKENNC